MGLFAFAPLAAEAKNAPYILAVEAHTVSDGKVELDITTNIPGTVEVMANIGLRNQKGDDLYVGTDNERILLSHGTGRFVFDVSKLPRGKYEAEVGFYPDWGFKDAASRASGIKHNIQINKPIDFTIHSSVSAQEQMALKTKQEWVMNHALPETPWKPAEWRKRFGASVFIPVVDDTWDPSIVKDYYFHSIDMRIRVNTRLHQIMGFEMGRGSDKPATPAFEQKPISPTMMTDFEPVVEEAVKQTLKDPGSAEFGTMSGKLTGEKSAIVCGNVNAKNSFGGYTGDRSFVSMISWGSSGIIGSASAIIVFADRTAAFRKLWKECQ
jgi:hypothetical protein